ncbi:hypothetical protein J6590_021043 [Homalodisca vitripennis]|nr:hypothetical protein J6590_021043 [Homalodisca vitripennis]
MVLLLSEELRGKPFVSLLQFVVLPSRNSCVSCHGPLVDWIVTERNGEKALTKMAAIVPPLVATERSYLFRCVT